MVAWHWPGWEYLNHRNRHHSLEPLGRVLFFLMLKWSRCESGGARVVFSGKPRLREWCWCTGMRHRKESLEHFILLFLRPDPHLHHGSGGWADQFPPPSTFSVFWLSYIRLCFHHLNSSDVNWILSCFEEFETRDSWPYFFISYGTYVLATQKMLSRSIRSTFWNITVGWAYGWDCGILWDILLGNN